MPSDLSTSISKNETAIAAGSKQHVVEGDCSSRSRGSRDKFCGADHGIMRTKFSLNSRSSDESVNRFDGNRNYKAQEVLNQV